MIEDDSIIHIENQISAIAGAIAEPARVKILCSLMNGQAWTATELGTISGVSPSTTSSHLDKLVKSGLISCLQQGRHRYFSITRCEIAELLEKMMTISIAPIPILKTKTPSHLRYARTCYDHLAGEVAVKIYKSMLEQQWLSDDQTSLSGHGLEQFEKLGIKINFSSKRKKACPCLDWSERHFHLGGEAGANLLSYCLEQKILLKTVGHREISITAKGKKFLQRWFNFSPTF